MKKTIAVFLAAGLLCGMAAVGAGAAPYDISSAFTDENFRAAIYEELGLPPEAPITQEDCEEIQMLDASEREIKSLEGIEYLINLTNLWVNDNQLTKLDLSKNPALTYLCCDNNQLTSLNVKKNPQLDCLECDSNQLTALNVTGNKKLRALSCYNNQIRSLNLRHNPELTWLYCGWNSWRLLDVSKNPKLEELDNRANGAVYGWDFRNYLGYSGSGAPWMERPVWLQWIYRYLLFGWVWMPFSLSRGPVLVITFDDTEA
ncbi:MAG: hypothetical protein LBG83_08480 [Oscillospiraceae bacterium]|nr:hypothetical protein [Oscillospiraceae bacterium]